MRLLQTPLRPLLFSGGVPEGEGMDGRDGIREGGEGKGMDGRGVRE